MEGSKKTQLSRDASSHWQRSSFESLMHLNRGIFKASGFLAAVQLVPAVVGVGVPFYNFSNI